MNNDKDDNPFTQTFTQKDVTSNFSINEKRKYGSSTPLYDDSFPRDYSPKISSAFQIFRENEIKKEREEQYKNILENANKRALLIIEEAKQEARKAAEEVKAEAKAHIEEESIRAGIGGGSTIVRTLQFKPEYQQAGIGILSYFSRILEKRYPDIPVSVTIEQFDIGVRMTVNAPNGDLETIEHEFEKYGEIVENNYIPDGYLPTKLDTVELKNKLKITSLELDMTRELLALSKEQHQDETKSFKKTIRALETQNRKLINMVDTLVQKDTSVATLSSLKIIDKMITNPVKPKKEDIATLKDALTVIHKNDQNMLESIKTFILNTSAGMSGNLIASSILKIIEKMY